MLPRNKKLLTSSRGQFVAPATAAAIANLFLLCILLLLFPSSSRAQIGTCDLANDTCPFQFDSFCDREFFIECENGDCFDCDPCRGFDHDCQGCIEFGCYWCPGDATCVGNSYNWLKIASCNAESDYVTSSCTTSENLFRSVRTLRDGAFSPSCLFRFEHVSMPRLPLVFLRTQKRKR